MPLETVFPGAREELGPCNECAWHIGAAGVAAALASVWREKVSAHRRRPKVKAQQVGICMSFAFLSTITCLNMSYLFLSLYMSFPFLQRKCFLVPCLSICPWGPLPLAKWSVRRVFGRVV